MNGTEPKIEIFKPFGEAWELMKKILFQPFDIQKWFVMGFAAFLANLSGGFHFNFPTNWSGRNWHPAGIKDWDSALDQLPHWVRDPVFIAAAIVIFVALIVFFSWLGARGRFILTDCIVKNRGAIVEPWREFRKEANSFFLFALLIAFVLMLLAAVLIGAVMLLMFLQRKNANHLPTALIISGGVLGALLIFLLALSWGLIVHFMVPVMYRRRCRAREAVTAVASLIGKYPGEFVLYLLFFVVLAIGAGLAACIAVCATCCVAAIPYIGSVILLPIFVLFRGFSFCFLRQFGPDYDVWQAIPQPEPLTMPPPPEPMPPPVQS